MKELIVVFLTEIPKLDAGAARRAASSGTRRLQRLAHAVKGAVDSCGASAAFDAAMLLERIGSAGG